VVVVGVPVRAEGSVAVWGVVFLFAATTAATERIACGKGVWEGSAVDTAGRIRAGVGIELSDLGVRSQTNRNGFFRFDSVGAGSHTLKARKIGTLEVSVVFQVLRDDVTSVDVVMKPVRAEAATPLAPVTVSADSRGSSGDQWGFLERKAGGQGTYFTSSDIEKIRPHRVSDLMRRVPGLKIFPNGEVFSNRGIVTINTESCAYGMPIYVDNVQVGGGAMGDPESLTDRTMNRKPDFMSPTSTSRSPIDGLKPSQISGIEIYNGPATAPSTISGTTSSCGAILIWTK